MRDRSRPSLSSGSAQGMAEAAFTQKIFPAGDGELPETRCLPLELSGSPVSFRHIWK